MDGTGSIEREPPSATERVAKLRLYLSPIELSELEAEGVIIVEEDNCNVREGPKFDVMWGVFE
jgi:hypothetical protein